MIQNLFNVKLVKMLQNLFMIKIKDKKNLNLISHQELDNHIIVLTQVMKRVDIKLILNIYVIELIVYMIFNKKKH